MWQSCFTAVPSGLRERKASPVTLGETPEPERLRGHGGGPRLLRTSPRRLVIKSPPGGRQVALPGEVAPAVFCRISTGQDPGSKPPLRKPGLQTCGHFQVYNSGNTRRRHVEEYPHQHHSPQRNWGTNPGAYSGVM